MGLFNMETLYFYPNNGFKTKFSKIFVFAQ